MTPSCYPVVQERVDRIAARHWHAGFGKVKCSARASQVRNLNAIHSPSDHLQFIDDFLYWVSVENQTGKVCCNPTCAFYRGPDQGQIAQYQNKVLPRETAAPLQPWPVTEPVIGPALKANAQTANLR